MYTYESKTQQTQAKGAQKMLQLINKANHSPSLSPQAIQEKTLNPKTQRHNYKNIYI